MGIPKIFKWLTERYPLTYRRIEDHQMPEVDNFYIDVNGIIHNCTHPNDKDPLFRRDEEEMLNEICSNLDLLVQLVKPKKMLVIAVDGVAPRAKMNQQRARRFRSAKEALRVQENARQKGVELPKQEQFDSNCITPGTAFMNRLHMKIDEFVSNSMLTKASWHIPRVVYSGHEVPGEGEHKVMEYIRYMKSQKNYDPMTRHCLYGMDSDLIMLGLCTHEPHFILLREEIDRYKHLCSAQLEDRTYYLFNVNILRDYIFVEFGAVQTTFNFTQEGLINDWVLLLFLIGNDFLPGLPGYDIPSNGIQRLYDAYKNVLPTLDGCINEFGQLNTHRLEKLVRRISETDQSIFISKNANLELFNNNASQEAAVTRMSSDLQDLIKSSDLLFEQMQARPQTATEAVLASCSGKLDGTLKDEFVSERTFFYYAKFKEPQITREVLADISHAYVAGLQWILEYYFCGVPSWQWYYPYHYAPYACDLKDVTSVNLNFELGEPFLPFQQLLGVLPIESKQLLPQPFHGLMEHEGSPLSKYFPVDVETDTSGKLLEWESVVLLPFIKQEDLIKFSNNASQHLNNEEQLRNKHGPMLVYESKSEICSHLTPQGQRAKKNQIVRYKMEQTKVAKNDLVMAICPGFDPDIYVPGFPSLRNLNYKGKLKNIHIKMFDRPSQKETMVITLGDAHKPPVNDNVLYCKEIAHSLLGTTVFVGYPYLEEARVTTVFNKSYIGSVDDSGVRREDVRPTKSKLKVFMDGANSAVSELLDKRGIELNNLNVFIRAEIFRGWQFQFLPRGELVLEKQWNASPRTFPLNAIRKSKPTDPPEQYKHVDDIVQSNGLLFIKVGELFGNKCKVQQLTHHQDKASTARVTVQVAAAFRAHHSHFPNSFLHYMTANDAQFVLGLPPKLFSCITGCIFVNDVQVDGGLPNIGLNLKFSTKREQVHGYSRHINGMWTYSKMTFDLVAEYKTQFPAMFDKLQQLCLRKKNLTGFNIREVFEGCDEMSALDSVLEWIKAKCVHKLERQKSGTVTLEKEDTLALEKKIDAHILNAKRQPQEITARTYSINEFFIPGLPVDNVASNGTTTFALLDRVVNVRDSFVVPLGLSGVVIGLNHNEDKITILFDEAFLGGLCINTVEKRCYKMHKMFLLNISFHKGEQATQERGTMIAMSDCNQASMITNREGFVSPEQKLALMSLAGDAECEGQASGAPKASSAAEFSPYNPL